MASLSTALPKEVTPRYLAVSDYFLDELPGHLGPLSGDYLGNDRIAISNRAFTPDGGLLLAHENMELLRQNAVLRAHIALITENVALARTKARLEGGFRASEVASGYGRRNAQTEQAPLNCSRSKRIANRDSMKQQRVQFLSRSRGSDLALGQTKLVAHADVPSDAASTNPGSGFTSEADESGIDESSVGPSEVNENPSTCRDELLFVNPVPESRTTAMMRNIPSEYTRANLLELIDQHGFRESYDMLYLPVDFQTERNHGYAFVNFTTPENAEKFRTYFSGFCDWLFPSDRVCEISWSDVLQGIDAHIKRYRDSPMMHESVGDQFRPILFMNGQRIPFPEPTKKIRAPRTRKLIHMRL